MCLSLCPRDSLMNAKIRQTIEIYELFCEYYSKSINNSLIADSSLQILSLSEL